MKEINFCAADIQANVELSTLSSDSNSIYQGNAIITQVDIQRFNNLFLILYQCYYHWFTKKNYLDRVFDDLTLLYNVDQPFLYFQRQVQQGRDKFVHGFSLAQVIFNLCEIIVIIAPGRSNFDKNISALLGIESVERFEEFLASQFISGEKDFVGKIKSIKKSCPCIAKNTLYRGRYQDSLGNRVKRISSPHTRVQRGKIFSIGACGSRMPEMSSSQKCSLSGLISKKKRIFSFVQDKQKMEILNPSQLRDYLSVSRRNVTTVPKPSFLLIKLYQQGSYQIFFEELLEDNTEFLRSYIAREKRQLNKLQDQNSDNLLFESLFEQKMSSYQLILDIVGLILTVESEFVDTAYSRVCEFIVVFKKRLEKIAKQQSILPFHNKILDFVDVKNSSQNNSLNFFFEFLKRDNVLKNLNLLIRGSKFITSEKMYFDTSAQPIYFRFAVLSIISVVVFAWNDEVENYLEKQALKAKKNRELAIFI